MTQQGILDGADRILNQDAIAIVITVILVGLQTVLWWRTWRHTRAPLRIERGIVAEVTTRLANGVVEAKRALDESKHPWLAHALELAINAGVEPNPRRDERISDAFDSGKLLPKTYNSRLDAAAPGLFMAIGIVGTFLGLMLGFVRVNPEDAGTSISPLLGGMVVAFFNSFVGVLLSIRWTYRSRRLRHEFDIACSELEFAVTRLIRPVTSSDLLLRELRTISAGQDRASKALDELSLGLTHLRESTDQSSKDLLENLSSTVGASFEALVNAPFDQLTTTVDRFNEIALRAGERQDEINRRIEAASETLAEAGKSLTTAVGLTRDCVDEFSVASMQMKDGANQVEKVVESARGAAGDIGSAVTAIGTAVTGFEVIQLSLRETTSALVSGSEALSANSARFETASGNLERAVSTLENATDATVQQSIMAVRNELQGAMSLLVDGIQAAGEKSISAYEKSSERVAKAVDGRMSDLTDRLSAELTTLANRLPSEVESLNQAMIQIRTQIQRATRAMDDSVSQLAHRTPEAMREQLNAYDRALAKAMDHFSGTLEEWSNKVTAIEQFSVEMRQANILRPLTHTPLVPPAQGVREPLGAGAS